MSGFLDTIDRLQKELQDLRPLKPEDQERLDKKFRLEFNYNSNHIEGNTLTYGETKLLLLFDDVKGNHTLREYEEMKSHDVAYKLIEEWAADSERPLSENKIKELNQILLVRPYWKEAITKDGQPTRREIKVGDYKQYSNSVRLENGEIFHYASPVDTPIKMQELIDWYRTEEGKMHPVELAAMLHYKFVSIHPFDDGNGRISRLLVNYVLIKNGLPPVVIKSSDKANYLRALHLADVGDIDAFVKYIGGQVVWSLEISIAAGKGEDIEEKNDWEKELDLIKRGAGLSTSKKIEERYNAENLQNIILETIYSFTEIWESKLIKFDPLFYERESSIVATSSNFINIVERVREQGDTFYEIFEKAFNGDIYTPPLIDDLLLETTYVKLKHQFRKTSFEGTKFKAGHVLLRFHSNAYEVSFGEILPPRTLFYGDFLSIDEIEHITDEFSKNLILQINAASK